MECRTCSKCGLEMVEGEFPLKGKVRKDGTRRRSCECKGCLQRRTESWMSKNMDRVKDNMKRRRLGPKRFQYNLWSSRTMAKAKGFEPCNATVLEIESAFTGFCHACGVLESECTKRLAMDHDHVTGVFRGWLCYSCNTALGLLRDSHERLAMLDDYLVNQNTVSC
jgi:hypothetical protein